MGCEHISFLEKKEQSKKIFDELRTDQRFTDAENNFKINVFYANIDNRHYNNFTTSYFVGTRFMGMNNIVNKFKFIFPKYLVLYSFS